MMVSDDVQELFDRVVPEFFDVTDEGVGCFVKVFKKCSKKRSEYNRKYYLKRELLVKELLEQN